MKYEVILSKQVTESCTVIVEADDADTAVDEAYEAAYALHHTEWSRGHVTGYTVEDVSPSETDAEVTHGQ